MPGTPINEVLKTMQEVKTLQGTLENLIKVVETIGTRLVQLERRIDSLNRD